MIPKVDHEGRDLPQPVPHAQDGIASSDNSTTMSQVSVASLKLIILYSHIMHINTVVVKFLITHLKSISSQTDGMKLYVYYKSILFVTGAQTKSVDNVSVNYIISTK